MISGRVDINSRKRVAELAAELKYLSSASFIRSLPVRDYRERALSFLREIFPVAMGERRFNDAPRHLVYGWKSRTRETPKGLAIELFHVGEKDDKVKTILAVLDKGSRAYTWTVKEDFRFYGKRYRGRKLGRGWVTFEEGRQISQPARKGSDYSDKTLDFVKEKLIPEMRGMIRNRIEERLKRIK